jgi:hypothetical protein
MYLLLGFVVLGGFAWWAHVSTTPKARPNFSNGTPVVQLRATSTPNPAILPPAVFGPPPTQDVPIMPFGYLGAIPLTTPESAQEGDNLELENVTQVAIAPTATATPWPAATRASIEPFKVYVFLEPELQNQIIVEYPYLVLTHQALPPGVSILETSRMGDEAFPTRQALRYGDAHLPPPTPVCMLRPVDCALVTYVTSTPAAPDALERAVGGAERFSGALPLAPRGRIERAS